MLHAGKHPHAVSIQAASNHQYEDAVLLKHASYGRDSGYPGML